MRTYQYTVHRDGPALWPEHKSLTEIQKLRATTPELIWEGTYQGNPTPAGGYTFKRIYWTGKNRYHFNDGSLRNQVLARYQSWDTAEEETETAAYSACITGEILTNYHLVIRHVYRKKLTFDALPADIESQARLWNDDGKLQAVIIEYKSSGKQAFQTLRATAPDWLRSLLFDYRVSDDKPTRAGAAAVWCNNDTVLLPHPGPDVTWLMDFEDELFTFPQSTFKDQVDAFSQLILFVENYLAAAWHAKGGKP